MKRLAVINDEILTAIDVAKQELDATVMSGNLDEEETLKYNRMIYVLEDFINKNKNKVKG